MKKLLSLMLISMLVLPAFAPWIPHEAMHALHDNHVSVHHGSNHHHSDDQHHHHTDTHHPIHVDVVSYFKDYLHVDLKKPEFANIDLQKVDSQGFDQLLALTVRSERYELGLIASRAPPDYLRLRPDKLPLYLSTQRLRI